MEFRSLNRVLGVELVMMGENHFSCRICLLSKKKNALSIENTKVIEGSLSIILGSVPKDLPIAIALSGKGIIHKHIQCSENLLDRQIFQNAFPSVEQKDFYLQQFNQGAIYFVSIIRRQLVDDLLDKFERAGLKTCMLSLGGLAASHVLRQINCYGEQVNIDGHSFSLTDEKELASYSFGLVTKGKFPVKIDQEPIAEENVVAYAVAFQLILYAQLDLVLAGVDSVNDAFSILVANERLKKRGLMLLFTLFGLLLLSYLLFSYYSQENGRLAEQLGATSANAVQLEAMQINIATNETFLKQLNWNGGYNLGFIMDELGRDMPRQLRLEQVLLNEYVSEDEKLERIPTIKVFGTTTNLTALNNWIFLLKEKAWIRSVRLLKYQQDQDSAAYQFNLVIIY